MEYVVGFMFDRNLQRVALIKKNKPEWQRGRMNGIGGKVEANEGPTDAMRREFQEETGCDTHFAQWRHFLEMSGKNDDGEEFKVDCFACQGDLSDLYSATDEEIVLIETSRVVPKREDMIENLPWLIAMAIDYLEDGRPGFVSAYYF